MLPASARLRRGSDIRVTSRGARRSASGLSASSVREPGRSGRRAAVIVNRQVGNAVTRNRLRRQVRHGLLRVWDELPRDVDVVVRASRAAQNLSPADLDAALIRIVAPPVARRSAGSVVR